MPGWEWIYLRQAKEQLPSCPRALHLNLGGR